MIQTGVSDAYTPPPPTPEHTLLGVGHIKGGRIKFLPRGASKSYTPQPPPLKNAFRRERKKTPKEIQHRICFLTSPLPPSKFFVCAFSANVREIKQPEHKEFHWLKAPKKGGFGHGILGEIFVFGCLFGPDKCLLARNGGGTQRALRDIYMPRGKN